MKETQDNSDKQVSLLTDMLKDLQSNFDIESQQHESLRRRLEENTSMFDLEQKYNAEVKYREDLGKQLLDECSLSAKRSEDAMATIGMLKNTNKILEEKVAAHRASMSAVESRCVALEQQISSSPSSLLVASAEVRVMEAKMIEFDRVCQQKVSLEQRNAAMRVR